MQFSEHRTLASTLEALRKQFNSPMTISDFNFSESDFFCDYNADAKFLDDYSEDDFWKILKDYGFLDNLKELGYDKPILRLECKDKFVHRLTLLDRSLLTSVDQPITEKNFLMDMFMRKKNLNTYQLKAYQDLKYRANHLEDNEIDDLDSVPYALDHNTKFKPEYFTESGSKRNFMSMYRQQQQQKLKAKQNKTQNKNDESSINESNQITSKAIPIQMEKKCDTAIPEVNKSLNLSNSINNSVIERETSAVDDLSSASSVASSDTDETTTTTTTTTDLDDMNGIIQEHSYHHHHTTHSKNTNIPENTTMVMSTDRNDPSTELSSKTNNKRNSTISATSSTNPPISASFIINSIFSFLNGVSSNSNNNSNSNSNSTSNATTTNNENNINNKTTNSSDVTPTNNHDVNNSIKSGINLLKEEKEEKIEEEEEEEEEKLKSKEIIQENTNEESNNALSLEVENEQNSSKEITSSNLSQKEQFIQITNENMTNSFSSSQQNNEISINKDLSNSKNSNMNFTSTTNDEKIIPNDINIDNNNNNSSYPTINPDSNINSSNIETTTTTTENISTNSNDNTNTTLDDSRNSNSNDNKNTTEGDTNEKRKRKLSPLLVSKKGAAILIKFLEKNINTTNEMKITEIEWVCMQNPKAKFSPSRPQCPGQRFPGLKMGRKISNLMISLAKMKGRDGLADTPEHFHNAAIYSQKGYMFINPAFHGYFVSILFDLNKDLRQHGLAAVSWAFKLGHVFNRKTGKPEFWHPEEQIYPTSDRLNKYFMSDQYLKLEEHYRKIHLGRIYIDWNEAKECLIYSIRANDVKLNTMMIDENPDKDQDNNNSDKTNL